MLKWLKTVHAEQPKQPTVLENAEFGHLTFDYDERWWAGTIDFADKRVELTVHAGLDGPTLRQRRVWTSVRDDLLDTSRRVIREYLSKIPTPEGANPIAADEFSLQGVELPPEQWIDSVNVVLTFSLLKDEGAIWRFEMKDGRVVSTSRDN